MLVNDVYKKILENLGTAVVLLDNQLFIQYMNPAAEMLLAASARQLSRRDIAEWFGTDADQVEGLRH